jgi:hypothetical protein
VSEEALEPGRLLAVEPIEAPASAHVGNRRCRGYKGVMRRAAHGTDHHINATLGSALTLTALVAALLVVLGALAPTAGAVTPNTTATAAQYPRNVEAAATAPSLQVPLGEETAPSEPATQLPLGEETAPSAVAGAQQAVGGAGSSERRLPFTGYLVLPILALGVAVLTVGVALRRRTAALPA